MYENNPVSVLRGVEVVLIREECVSKKKKSFALQPPLSYILYPRKLQRFSLFLLMKNLRNHQFCSENYDYKL